MNYKEMLRGVEYVLECQDCALSVILLGNFVYKEPDFEEDITDWTATWIITQSRLWGVDPKDVFVEFGKILKGLGAWK